jgi:hypothetical protein
MSFHDLEDLSPAAIAALASTCEALITADGRAQATPREHELLQILFPALLDKPYPASVSPQVPPHLSGFLTTRRQRQEVMQLLTLLACLEPRLDEAKLTLLQRIATEFDVEPGVVEDLQKVCQGHVLKAYADLWRRSFHALNHDSLVQGFAHILLPMLDFEIDHEHEKRYHALASAPADSLGKALHAYYERNRFPYPGTRKGLPYPYISTHDIHHVIGGYDTTPAGELQVLAFTMGLFPDHALLVGVVGLLQFQMGFTDPMGSVVAPRTKDQLNAPAFAVALQRGADVTGPIRDFQWNFWDWTDRPLKDVRREMNVL